MSNIVRLFQEEEDLQKEKPTQEMHGEMKEYIDQVYKHYEKLLLDRKAGVNEIQDISFDPTYIRIQKLLEKHDLAPKHNAAAV